MSKRKAMSSEKARFVRLQGHIDALEFAKEIGLQTDYQNNSQAKKDVVDHNGDTHSVKSGVKRWQIFLYGKNCFETDNAFQSMNGIGQILIECLDVYPTTYDEYKENKSVYKEKLRIPMKALCKKFEEQRRVKTFIHKSMFNGGEVDYLTVKHDNVFHIFSQKDVVRVMGEYLEITNSHARKINDTPEQKVLFKYNGNNVGELEMRNSNYNHYKEVLFVMNKLKALELLFEKIQFKETYNEKIWLYGETPKKFNKRSVEK